MIIPKKPLLGIVVVASFFILISVVRSKNRSKDTLAPVERGTIAEAVYGIGTVKAEKTYQLKVSVPGNIRKLSVKEGDQVKEGGFLINFEGQNFHAPFDGTVTALFYKLGETVAPQTPILSVVDLKQKYLEVSLEQQGALRVRPGQRASINIESIREKSYLGSVRSLYSFESNFLVQIEVTTLPLEVLPGMTADVGIQTGTKENAIIIPASAVTKGRVRRRRSGNDEEVAITLGQRDAERIEVLTGDLAEGDQVLVPSVVK